MASWFEERRQRRKRRERMEEVIGWIVVPMIGVMLWWAWLQVSEQVKGTPLIGIITGKDRGGPAPP
ncbi:hypothetical protein [Alsobacter sp. R-9]